MTCLCFVLVADTSLTVHLPLSLAYHSAEVYRYIPGLGRRSGLWSARPSLLETFFSDMSKLLTVIALESLLIFLFPSPFQESGPWGKGQRSSSRSLLIRVLTVGCIHPSMLFLLLCLYLSYPGPIRGGVHGVWVTGRLVLRLEGVEEFYPSLLLASVFEVDPFCMARQGSFLPFCIVARSIQSQHVLV